MTTAEDTTLPFQFPNDWQTTYVGDEFFLILGKMLDAEKNVGVPRPYLGNKSVQWGRIDTKDLSLIKLTPGDLRRYRLMDGDLLVCEGGDIGRSAIWRGQLDECYFQKALHRVRPRGGFSPVLLRYLLEYYSKTSFLLNFATQTSIAHLPKDKFEVLPLPKPPLKEQEAIAEALSDADALIEGLERLIAKKRLIKQGAMQDLLTSNRRLPGFSGEWVERRLGEIASFGKGKGLPKSEVHTAGEVACVHYGSLFREQPTVIQELSTFTDKFSGATYSCSGDVLMPTSDVTPSGLAVASCIQMDGILLGGDILVVRPSEAELDGRFLAATIRHSKNQIMELVSGSTVFHIYGRDMKRFTFHVPPLDEQQEIVTVFEDMDSEIQALENRLEKARQVKEGMMQNLLTGRIRLV